MITGDNKKEQDLNTSNESFVKRYRVRQIGATLFFIFLNYFVYLIASFLYEQRHTFTSGRHFLNMTGVAIMYLCLYLVLLDVLRTKYNVRVLRQRGIRTPARIIDSYHATVILHVVYEYIDLNGKVHTKKYGVHKNYQKNFFQEYVQDNSFEAIYDPQKPERCYPLLLVDIFKL